MAAYNGRNQNSSQNQKNPNFFAFYDVNKWIKDYLREDMIISNKIHGIGIFNLKYRSNPLNFGFLGIIKS